MEGRSVILQAPTGAGKTRAALYPFLRAWEYEDDFPCKCIYSVPLRVLANQFWDEYEGRTRNFGFRRPLDVTIQTGDRPEDPKLEGNLIFTTVDQTLSNFLNIPYALGLGQGNLNAGAALSSYLVFDELHLFDSGTMLPTTLNLLRLLRGVVPFVVMTATLSGEMVQTLAKELDAETVVLTPEEVTAIPSQHKTRRIHTVESELGAEAVLERHRCRSIAICNTVDRGQELFEELRQKVGPSVEIRLLHSRFLRADRQDHEDWLRREFGKDKTAYTVESAILVATQVVEVGLDITSENLHTELAPAASVVQRVGRCARYEGEEGDVWVYRLPVNDDGRPRYAPYLGEQKAICEKAWSALSERSGEVFDFGAELAVVNQAHGETDQKMLERLQANRFYIADRIAATIEAQERGAARELIRAVDSRTVIVHPDPESIENPWDYEGFGIFRGSLFGAYETLVALADELVAEWVLMTADPLPETESSRERTVWRWRPIMSKEDLEGVLLVAVNPQLAAYSPETGFRLGVKGDGTWQSPPRERRKARREFAPYRRETFQEHIARMTRVYSQPFFDNERGRGRLPLAEELAYAARRLEQKHKWPSGVLDNLARWIIALHDLGKLDVRWQEWAHRWQAKVSDLRGEDLRIPDNYLAAHTDYNERNEAEKALNYKLRRLKPNHAAESAAAAMDWLLDHTGDQALARAALTAIVRHHSASASGQHGEFRAHPAAKDALKETLGEINGIQWHIAEGELGRRLIRPRREKELLAYLLLARALRLADQRSQEIAQ
jgi:CRISPR-associated endonuclease/helicase Cas3